MATSSCWWMARSSPYWELAFFSRPFLPHQPGCTAEVFHGFRISPKH